MTEDYWEQRYSNGGTSGVGSRGEQAELKARFVNEAVALHGITSLLDIGCGDGYQASLFQLGACKYLGIDQSRAAIKIARRTAQHMNFQTMAGDRLPLDAHLSMDVLHHLIDEQDYRAHLDMLFSARRFALVYGTNRAEAGNTWVLHREWTPDVPQTWEIVETRDAMDDKRWWVWRRR